MKYKSSTLNPNLENLCFSYVGLFNLITLSTFSALNSFE